MDLLRELNASLAVWTRAHLAAIATAFTTALLVIYGDNINRAVKNRVRNRCFLLRTVVFVLLCAFGYGLLTVLIAPAIANLLSAYSGRYLVPAVALAFIGIGFLGERKRYM